MYTTRGYRQHARENRKKSEYGQIIQRRPTFQIDNNPVVLDAYKQFIFSTMPKLLRTQLDSDTHEITLSEYTLSWTSSDKIDDILEALKAVAEDIFNQYESQGKYPISLELYSPNLIDSNGWWVSRPSSSPRIASANDSIIIDRMGHVSYTQYGTGFYLYSNAWTSADASLLTLAYGSHTAVDPPSITFGSPLKMKADVYFLQFYNGN